MIAEKIACRACGWKLPDVVLLNFGLQAIVDFLGEGETGRGYAPLQLVQCEQCGLLQLRHTVEPDVLFKKFWYRSSINEQMRFALKDIVDSVSSILEPDDVVCDIGSNDGELLWNYPPDVHKVGFEPAEELARESSARFAADPKSSFFVVPGYFNAIEAAACMPEKGFKVITSVAMFYDLDDPVSFLYDVKACLAKDGVFVVQMNYLGTMVKNLTFDNICHEHLCYYSLTTLKNLFDKVGLDIYDVRLNDVNGGSFRVYASHRGASNERPSVRELLLQENTSLDSCAIKNFAEASEANAKLLFSFLKEAKKANKKVYAYGASTRGLVLLQVILKDYKATDYIIAAAERDERKFGKKMAGLSIPIVSEEEARREADYMLVLPYHFWSSIKKREYYWMKGGGAFILPLPYPKVVKQSQFGLVAQDLLEASEMLKV